MDIKHTYQREKNIKPYALFVKEGWNFNMEWSNEQKYNSFNSVKGLAYYENYKNIVAWLNEETSELLPPIECNLDPIAECNLRCYFCITQRYLRNNRAEVGEMRKLPTEYMYRLVDFLAQWGVRGLCISGGGEPSLHKDICYIISYAKHKDMDVAFVTNATHISDMLATALMQCRWVALSVDSANLQTYEKVKGKDLFEQVIKNITHLAKLRAKTNSNVDLCFKYLVLPENYGSIYEACRLAKELGVQDFHVRPVDFERSDIERHQKLAIDVDKVKELFEECHKLENNNFHVYTITHKFDDKFHVKYDYSACLAASLLLPILSDGNAYLCVEHKMEAKYKLGSCYPDPENILNWWGSDKHRQMIKSIVPKRDCSRCIYSGYNQQIEQVVIQDKMCLSFP